MDKRKFFKKSSFFIVFIALFIVIPSLTFGDLAEKSIGGDEGWYLVHCDVDWAQVYFDNEYIGDISQGVLKVMVHTTAPPYSMLTVSKEGCTIWRGRITEFPKAGQTVDLYAITPILPIILPEHEFFSGIGEKLQINSIFVDQGEETRTIRKPINFTTLYKPLYHVDVIRCCTPPLTSSTLKLIIESEYPELNDENITDWEKVNILREWAYEHTDYFANTSNTLDTLDPDYYRKTAPELYQMFFNDRGGVVCGGMAHALQQIYEIYGFTSFTYNMGDPNYSNHTSHVITLVRINYFGRQILTVQDPYFDITILDKQQNPLDILDVIRLVREGRCSDLLIQDGLKKPKDMILLKNQWESKRKNMTGWFIIQNDSPVDLGEDRVKVKIQMSLEKYDNTMRNRSSVIKNSYINEACPYLGLYQYPIHVLRAQTYVYSVSSDIINCSKGIECSPNSIESSKAVDKLKIINLTPISNMEINESYIYPNCYNGLCYTTSKNGSILFTRRSIRDHIASKYFILPVNSTKEQMYIAKITFSDKEQVGIGLNIYIQDDEYRFISDDLNDYVLSDSEEGNYVTYSTFTVPPTNRSIRITFLSSDYEEHILPLTIEIFQENT